MWSFWTSSDLKRIPLSLCCLGGGRSLGAFLDFAHFWTSSLTDLDRFLGSNFLSCLGHMFEFPSSCHVVSSLLPIRQCQIMKSGFIISIYPLLGSWESITLLLSYNSIPQFPHLSAKSRVSKFELSHLNQIIRRCLHVFNRKLNIWPSTIRKETCNSILNFRIRTDFWKPPLSPLI